MTLGEESTLCWLGYLPPHRRTWDSTLNKTSDRTKGYPLKGPGTRGWGIPPHPPTSWMGRYLWKHYLPPSFGMRAVASSITVCNVEVSPPPPSGTSAPSALTQQQMVFVGPQHIPNFRAKSRNQPLRGLKRVTKDCASPPWFCSTDLLTVLGKKVLRN